MSRGHTFERLLRSHGPGRIVEALRPYLTEARRDRIETVLAGRMQGVQVAIEAPCDPHNAAAVVRTAEAFGILDVHVIAVEGEALKYKKTSSGSCNWVRTHHHPDLGAFLRRVPVTLAGAWMDAPLPLCAVPCAEPICLILGNENRGLSRSARAACELGFRIPMYGMTESLNLSVSAAVALYDVLTRRRAALGESDLDARARAELRARYYVDSVDDRLATGILGAA